MFGSNVVRKQIMEVLEPRIEEAEKEYKQEVERLENELIAKLENIRDVHRIEKTAALSRVISSVISKIL